MIYTITLKTESWHHANVVGTGGTRGCRYGDTCDDKVGMTSLSFIWYCMRCALLYFVCNDSHGSCMFLLWHHSERDGVSNNRRLDSLFNLLSSRRSKKTSKLRVTGLCEGNSSVTGEFSSQRASNAENVSIWWRQHVFIYQCYSGLCHSVAGLWYLLMVPVNILGWESLKSPCHY